jgi:primary-amine oxidase
MISLGRIPAAFRLAAACLVLPVTGFAQSSHPLDPLTWEEHWTILQVLQADGKFNDSTRVALVTLHEPPKTDVWAWTPGAPLPRMATAVVKQQANAYETIVDLGARQVVSWKEASGQPNWLPEEFEAMADKVKEHPEVIAAFRRRGIADLTFVECGGGPPGRFGTPEENGRRIAHYGCGLEGPTRNGWTRGIEALVAVVDMDTKEILRVVDEGAVPIPETNADYDRNAVGPLRTNPTPIAVEQPLGPSFTLDGHQVRWDRWSFHVRPDQRVGVIVSTVRYGDGGRERPVMYQGNLSEIFVPYMDPSANWYARNFLDAGEYVADGLGKPLARGVDCPTNAQYLDLIVVRGNGRPRDVSDVICIFERYAGDVAWRHLASTIEGRPKRDLVVRFAAVLGNYDYLFDWVFQQDGTIRVGVGATGIAEVKIVAQRSAGMIEQAGDGGASVATPDAYGRFVDRHIVAVNHDHYFNFRLDLDVDGPVNSFQRDRLETVRLPDDHPRRSIWALKSEVARRERDAQLNVNLKRPALWRFVNPAEHNAHGYASSYHITPGKVVETLLSEDDWPRQRAGFIDHHLWVTPYAADELYAAGMYPTLSEPGEGLPAYTARNRVIENTDIVAWFTMGMHHVVRAEDWPTMPVAWSWVDLRPFDFFDRNPALDLPMVP